MSDRHNMLCETWKGGTCTCHGEARGDVLYACASCGEWVKPEDAAPRCVPPTAYHRICFDISVADLAAQLENHADEQGWPSRVDERGRKLYTLPER